MNELITAISLLLLVIPAFVCLFKIKKLEKNLEEKSQNLLLVINSFENRFAKLTNLIAEVEKKYLELSVKDISFEAYHQDHDRRLKDLEKRKYHVEVDYGEDIDGELMKLKLRKLREGYQNNKLIKVTKGQQKISQRLEQVKKLRQKNLSRDEIAKKLNVSVETIRIDLKKLGMNYKRGRENLPKQLIDKIIKLKNEGKSGTDIAKKLNIAINSAYKYMRQYRVTE